MLLARMEVILEEFLVEQSLSISESGERALMSDVMCVLEVRVVYAVLLTASMSCCACQDDLYMILPICAGLGNNDTLAPRG